MSHIYGVSWYGNIASIAQTGFRFTREEAVQIAKAGAEAPNFWAWAKDQPFAIDELTDGSAIPVVRADAETEDQSGEFTAWVKNTQCDVVESCPNPAIDCIGGEVYYCAEHEAQSYYSFIEWQQSSERAQRMTQQFDDVTSLSDDDLEKETHFAVAALDGSEATEGWLNHLISDAFRRLRSK